jgi:hypothetical protein
MNNYRLSPKPGIVNAGRFVKTHVAPKVNVNHQGNAAQVIIPQRKIEGVKKVPKAEPQPTPVPAKENVRAKREPPHKSNMSPLRRSQEKHHTPHHNKAVLELRNKGVGRILIMVACGPSILEADLPKLKGHQLIDIMSINKPDPRLYPTTYWAFCDQSQYVRNQALFEHYDGVLLNAWSVRAKHKKQVLIKNRPGHGFSKDLSLGYHIGRSTTYANMQTALWMNYDKVFIFGCDMAQPANMQQLHFYGVNPDVQPEIRVKRFEKEAEHYHDGAQKMTQQERSKFVFCSAYNPWPFINFFQKMDHREAVDHILGLANNMLPKNNSEVQP